MIKIDGLSKTFKTGFFMTAKQAVSDLNLQVKEGDVYGFIGPNGAGKSTTIKILLGLLRFSQGNVSILGESPSKYSVRQQIGYLPEHPYFYDYLSGYELVKFYGELLGFSGAELSKRVDEALEQVHASEDWIHRKLRGYSKGMMQRIGLAQAILNRPKLLILDEPMSGLDPVGRKDVRDIIQTLNQKGTTIFYSSHVLGDVESISNRIGIIIGGSLEKEGDIQDILQTEEAHFAIGFEQKVDWNSSPFASLQTKQNLILCPDEKLRSEVLAWGQGQNLELSHLEKMRPSLEDVLTKEIARHD